MAVINQKGLADGVKFFRDDNRASDLERNWAAWVRWTRDNRPNGYHHMGMHWTEIYQVVPKELYLPGILRVAHYKLGPKNITCLRKERLPGGRLRWVLSYHWEGFCPACSKPSIARAPKLIRRQNNNNPEPMKLLRRK